MITRYRKKHRLIATIFLLIFFPTLVPNNLFASNNGPKAPEAASFEPVDATDMVNLLTGQYSYVLPLLNVPSPEGGYPLALSYHSGIALDQGSSWTGLGWNLNPGAINRNVNGYPDDINSTVEEFFYDEGTTTTVNTLSLNYSTGTASVGVGISWGSNQAIGGYVSAGVGFDLGGGNKLGVNINGGTNGASVGIGLKTAGGLTLGVSASDSGGLAGSIGQIDTNGSGFSISSDGIFSLKSNSVSIYASSSGVGVSLATTIKGFDSKAGAGINLSFKNTYTMGDYSLSQSGWSIPLTMPMPVGFFGITYGRHKYNYSLNKRGGYTVLGPIQFPNASAGSVGNVPNFPVTPIFDTNELTISENNETLNSKVEVTSNNIVLPNYDSYDVNAQGLSGSVSPHIFKNGILTNQSTRDISSGYRLIYPVNYDNYNAWNFNGTIPEEFKLDPVNFYFDNEISTYLNYTDVNPALFINSTNLNSITKFFDLSSASPPKPKRKTSNYVEYFKINELNRPSFLSNSFAKGFLKATTNFNYDDVYGYKDNIGAFKITAIDGKTYHYSLPVYNHEIVTRTQGTINGKPERESYFEKRQLNPYATHWLLTAITGPDFIDNGDGVAGNGDLGYWVSYEYGKWSDAFVWKAPYKKDFIVDENNPNIKTWIRGRKQMYYLDRVKTRTHTAVFVKSPRTFESSPSWQYKQVNHNNGVVNTARDFDNGLKFTIPSQSQLKLDKIILLKNEDDIINKSVNQQSNSLTVVYGQSNKIYSYPTYNCYNNVIDNLDNWNVTISKSIKVINFDYDYSLVPGDNRLTLKGVSFNGKQGASVLPPYKFDYINDTNSFNIDNQDGWGYLTDRPETFSLNKITTPQGGTINIGYENTKFKSVTPVTLEFSNTNSLKYTSTLPNPFPTSSTDMTGKKVIINIGSNQDYPLYMGQNVNINYLFKYLMNGGQMTPIFERTYLGTGKITALPNILGNGRYEVTFDNNAVTNQVGVLPGNIIDLNPTSVSVSKISVSVNLDKNVSFEGGGTRVANLKISDGINNYFTNYRYGQNEDGIGYVSYIPFAPNITKELSYGSFLPTPRPMYEYVSVYSETNNKQSLGKIRFKFNVFKEKSANQIKYGDFFEITKKSREFTNYSTNEGNFSSDYYGTKNVSIGEFVIKDNLSSIGQLLEVATFNSQGHLLNKISNEYYKTTDIIPSNMGVKKESFQQYKIIDFYDVNLNDKWLISSSTNIKYPSVLKSSTEQSNGYTYTTQFNDYDLISGVSKEQVYTSSNGQTFKTKTIPAYLKYPAMGSKVDNPTNKNMLSQTAAEYSYILDKPSNTWKVTGVGITTWNNLWNYRGIAGEVSSPSAINQKIWRKHKSYTWNGAKDSDGIFLNYGDNDDNFNWDLPTGVGIDVTQPAQWKQLSEITLYDHFSAPLEMKDINGNKASSKMGDNETKIMVTGNAGYNEMFYSGAENTTDIFGVKWLEPDIKMSNAKTTNLYAHTGKLSVEATSSSDFGVFMKGSEHRSGKYKVSVWVHKSSASNAVLFVNNSFIPFTESYSAGNWVLKSAIIKIETPVSSVNGNSADCSINVKSSNSTVVYLDDLMIRPVSSTISGYVYNEWDELTHIIGNNGLATRFEYDAAGRLIKTSAEVIDDSANGVTGGFKTIKTNTYNNKYSK